MAFQFYDYKAYPRTGEDSDRFLESLVYHLALARDTLNEYHIGKDWMFGRSPEMHKAAMELATVIHPFLNKYRAYHKALAIHKRRLNDTPPGVVMTCPTCSRDYRIIEGRTWIASGKGSTPLDLKIEVVACEECKRLPERFPERGECETR